MGTDRLFSRNLELHVPIELAWKALSDTNRLNRALGLPPVEFTSPIDTTLIRTATAKGNGKIPLSWDEPPFECIEQQLYCDHRSEVQGPIGTPKEIYSGMKLSAAKDSTRIEIFAALSPSKGLGTMLTKNSLGDKALDNLEKLCRALEGQLQKNPRDPFPSKPGQVKANLDRLEQSLRPLQGQVPQKILDHLASALKQDAEEDVIQMRPFV